MRARKCLLSAAGNVFWLKNDKFVLFTRGVGLIVWVLTKSVFGRKPWKAKTDKRCSKAF